MVYFPKWKVALVLVVCLLGVAYSLPNFLPKSLTESLPAGLPSQQVNLGLDLQGGSHLLLEVEIDEVIKQYLEGIAESARAELRTARIRARALGVADNAVVVTIAKADEVEKAHALLKQIEPGAQVSIDGERITITPLAQTLAERRSSALQQSVEILRRRIDETGTREPTIQRQGENRVLVQVPGLKDPERLKAIIGRPPS